METIFNRRGAVRFTRADITTLAVDAIVNSANPSLSGIGPDLPAGVGGVDGAIHRAAGLELYAACLQFPTRAVTLEGAPVRCRPGDIAITSAFALPCRQVIHGVAPRYRRAADLGVLARLYRKIFAHFRKERLAAIALPPIGVRSFGFPGDMAAKVALAAAIKTARGRPGEILFSLIDDRDYATYARIGPSLAMSATRALWPL